MAKVVLSAQACQAVRKDMLERPRIEACGLLIGEITEAGDWMAREALPLRNTRNSAVRFEFDSEELLTYDLTYGERIIGVYHSHPGGAPFPSGIDKGNMENMQESPWVWLIASFHGRVRRGDGGADDALQIAAYRQDPHSGLETIPVLIAAPSEEEDSPQ